MYTKKLASVSFTKQGPPPRTTDDYNTGDDNVGDDDVDNDDVGDDGDAKRRRHVVDTAS